MNALATPDRTAAIVAPSSTPPPSSVMTSRSVTPIGYSPTPARCVEPDTVHTIVPGDRSVPNCWNHGTPLARISATVDSVSTLFASVGAAPPTPAIATWAAEMRPSPISSAPCR